MGELVGWAELGRCCALAVRWSCGAVSSELWTCRVAPCDVCLPFAPQDMIPQISAHFDFAINEECFTYNECSLYKGYFTNKPVVVIE